MPENGMPGPVCDLSSVREAVCIHTHKIFDSCRDKDCVEDLRFYPTASAQEVLSACQMVRGGTAELLYVYTDVEPVTFNRGVLLHRYAVFLPGHSPGRHRHSPLYRGGGPVRL